MNRKEQNEFEVNLGRLALMILIALVAAGVIYLGYLAYSLSRDNQRVDQINQMLGN
jgi:threonine/homoserine/homoserine lactone efflux protein